MHLLNSTRFCVSLRNIKCLKLGLQGSFGDDGDDEYASSSAWVDSDEFNALNDSYKKDLNVDQTDNPLLSTNANQKFNPRKSTKSFADEDIDDLDITSLFMDKPDDVETDSAASKRSQPDTEFSWGWDNSNDDDLDDSIKSLTASEEGDEKNSGFSDSLADMDLDLGADELSKFDTLFSGPGTPRKEKSAGGRSGRTAPLGDSNNDLQVGSIELMAFDTRFSGPKKSGKKKLKGGRFDRNASRSNRNNEDLRVDTQDLTNLANIVNDSDDLPPSSDVGSNLKNKKASVASNNDDAQESEASWGPSPKVSRNSVPTLSLEASRILQLTNSSVYLRCKKLHGRLV